MSGSFESQHPRTRGGRFKQKLHVRPFLSDGLIIPPMPIAEAILPIESSELAEKLRWTTETSIQDYINRSVEIDVCAPPYDLGATISASIDTNGNVSKDSFNIFVNDEDKHEYARVTGGNEDDLQEFVREWFLDNSDLFNTVTIYEELKDSYSDQDWARCVVEYDCRKTYSDVAMDALCLPEDVQVRVQSILNDENAVF